METGCGGFLAFFRLKPGHKNLNFRDNSQLWCVVRILLIGAACAAVGGASATGGTALTGAGVGAGALLTGAGLRTRGGV
jgi:hypothetical protein